jgi:hypothetical protein
MFGTSSDPLMQAMISSPLVQVMSAVAITIRMDQVWLVVTLTPLCNPTKLNPHQTLDTGTNFSWSVILGVLNSIQRIGQMTITDGLHTSEAK